MTNAMFRKIVTAVIVIPLAAIIIAFAVANRQWVTVSFDPFSSASPAYAATMPLFVLIFIVLILGVIVGGIAAWIRQSKWRRAARGWKARCARCTRNWRRSAGNSSATRRGSARARAAAGHPAADALTGRFAAERIRR